MTIQIPETIQKPPLFRVQYAATFGGTSGDCTKSTSDWTTIDQPSTTGWGYGAELLSIKRRAFPDVGTAVFRIVVGDIPGPTADAPELIYYEVLLQLYDEINAVWKTAFWGQVTDIQYKYAPGASGVFLTLEYHCVDGFARTTKWILNYTGYDSGGSARVSPFIVAPGRGNPGYNYMLDSDGPLLGNMSPSQHFQVDGINVQCHTFQGAFAVNAANPGTGGNTNPALQTNNKWTERQMVNHATTTVKPDGEPCFALADSDPTDEHGLDVYSPQPVYDNESVFDFCMRVLNRRRGQGTTWVDWTDNDDGSISVFLGYCPPIIDDLTYPVPGQMSLTATIQGAENAGRIYTNGAGNEWVDLQGDSRNIDDLWDWVDAAAHLFDELNTVGECIESAVTLCMYDGSADDMTSVYDDDSYSLAPRWSPTDVYTFTQLDYWMRTQPYWNFLFQAVGLPRTWGGFAGNGINTDKQRVDFRCDADGNVVVPSGSDYTDTLANMVQILGYLPFYEGYNYSGTVPQKTDSSLQYGLPQRRPPMILLRPSGWESGIYVGYDTDRWFLPGGNYPQTVTNERVSPQSLGDLFSPSVTVQPDGIVMTNLNAQQAGIRQISDPVLDDSIADTDNQLQAYLPITRVAITVGLLLPHRLSFTAYASYGGTRQTSRKRKVIYIENAHLWLAAANCIYDLSQTDADLVNGQGYSPLRNALGSTDTAPAVLRDDRPLVARYHALASDWYLNQRTRVKWGQQYCGLLPFLYEDGYGGTMTDMAPTLGQMLLAVGTNGGFVTVNTVVTAVDYDHQNMVTTWETDYYDLEMR